MAYIQHVVVTTAHVKVLLRSSQLHSIDQLLTTSVKSCFLESEIQKYIIKYKIKKYRQKDI